MSSPLTIAIAVLVFCFLTQVPLVFSMLSSCIVYYLIKGWDVGFVGNLIMNTFYTNYVIIAIPLFLFTANVMNNGKVTEKIFDFCKYIIGPRKGALAYVNVVASIIFAGMTGSAFADSAGLGAIEIASMRKEGFEDGFSCAITAASSTIGPIIPPSIPFVIYAMISGVSVGALFLGGVIPGLLIGAVLMIYITLVARKRNMPAGIRVTARQLLRITLQSIPALLTPVILLIGIYTGVMTPTEAGAVAGLYAVLLSVIVYRVTSLKSLFGIIKDTVVGTGAVSIMVGVAAVFNYIIARERIADTIEAFVRGNISTQFGFLAAVTILFLVLGMVIDNSVSLLVFVPILIPIASSYGVSLLHFGVICVLNQMIGLSTPPYGMCLFVTSAISKTPWKDVMREVIPMDIMMIIALILVTFVPSFITWLPGVLMG